MNPGRGGQERESRRVGDLLREFLEARGWASGDPCTPLFTGWKDIVGPALASHSRLADVDDGVLVVDVDHPGWMQMLALRRQAVLEAARRAAPKAHITGLRGRIGR
jgi:predicted nucleic acid-binding Zn ribbon protein